MIKQCTFKGLESIVMENDFLKATFIPCYGGKLASLYDKEKNYEWLFQKDEELKVPPYGADFSEYDSSGFDEVFPSIDKTYHPFNGEVVPDHGEVWTLPWKVTILDNQLLLEVVSPRFPYSIKKQIKLAENELQIQYQTFNNSDKPFSFIWTPHALLNLNQYTEIQVPSHLKEVITVEHSTVHLGEWGSIHSYPLTYSLNTGEPLYLNKMWGPTDQTCEKFYFTEKLQEGWCRILQRDLNRQMTFAFPKEKVPYLGVWKTQGGYRGDYNFALEPCTGIYDDVYVAEKIRKVSSIPPNGSYSWWFYIKIENI